MKFDEEIADEVSDRLAFALGGEAVEVAEAVRRAFKLGTAASRSEVLRTLVAKVVAEAKRVEPTITRRAMVARSREMRACG